MKIICPNCEKISEVSKDAKEVTCEACGQTFDINTGKQKTIQKYKELQNNGYMCLYRLHSYERAIELYEDSLEIKPNDMPSIVGICLAKALLSKLDKTNFNEVEKIIDSYDIYLNLENTTIFLDFTTEMLNLIRFYYNQVDSRLVSNGAFICKNYFNGYVSALKDIKDLIIFLKNAQNLMDKKELDSYKEDDPSFEENEEEILKETNARLNKIYNVNHFGDIQLKDGEEEILGTNKVDNDDETVSDLSLTIRNEKGIAYSKIFLPIIAVVGVTGVILLFTFIKIAKLPILIVGLILVVASLILFGVYRHLLKKNIKK